MFVSDLTNHSVRSGVDLLLSLLTIPQKLHSRQYGIHSKRMNTHVNSSWVSRHLGEGKVSSCFYMILGWTRLMSIVFSLGKSFALIPQCVFSIIDLSPHLIVVLTSTSVHKLRMSFWNNDQLKLINLLTYQLINLSTSTRLAVQSRRYASLGGFKKTKFLNLN